MSAPLSVSIVSHGHGSHVRGLLALLARPGATPVARVWLTLNVAEPDLLALGQQSWPFALHLVCNTAPLGFGANHNQAFAREQLQPIPASFFVVLNPDMAWTVDPFPALLEAAQQPMAGCAYPMQLDPQGREQDHRRLVPSPRDLLKRYLGQRANPESTPAVPDWVNAAFLVFPAPAYAKVGGFDPRYFMYCEDVDICIRLQLAGYRLVDSPKARVVHDANRASHRNVRHLVWHIRSLWRLWRSSPYQAYQTKRPVVTIRG